MYDRYILIWEEIVLFIYENDKELKQGVWVD